MSVAAREDCWAVPAVGALSSPTSSRPLIDEARAGTHPPRPVLVGFTAFFYLARFLSVEWGAGMDRIETGRLWLKVGRMEAAAAW